MSTPQTEQQVAGDYRLEVTDFGPLVKASVDLRPLTVFIGPSNTGKSYLAILIYILHKTLHHCFTTPRRAISSSPQFDREVQEWARRTRSSASMPEFPKRLNDKLRDRFVYPEAWRSNCETRYAGVFAFHNRWKQSAIKPLPSGRISSCPFPMEAGSGQFGTTYSCTKLPMWRDSSQLMGKDQVGLILTLSQYKKGKRRQSGTSCSVVVLVIFLLKRYSSLYWTPWPGLSCRLRPGMSIICRLTEAVSWISVRRLCGRSYRMLRQSARALQRTPNVVRRAGRFSGTSGADAGRAFPTVRPRRAFGTAYPPRNHSRGAHR